MKLLIDIGNSRLKWCLETEQGLQTSSAVAHQDEFASQLKTQWQSLGHIKQLKISSVSSKTIVATIIDIAQQLWTDNLDIVIAKTQASALGVTNAYPEAQKLGVDRWLCLLATRHFYPNLGWIIDCGTAITLDYLDSQGNHQGGLICSGFQLMQQALFTNTEALKISADSATLGLATNTPFAIYNGTLMACVGLIEQSLALSTPDAHETILLTGGDAERIAPHLSHPILFDADLVLKGLSLYSPTAL